MTSFILVIHLIVAITLVVLVLLQRSEGGGLGNWWYRRLSCLAVRLEIY